MREVAVSGFVLAPASSDRLAQESQLLDRWLPSLITSRKAISPGFPLSYLRFQAIYLPPRPCLPPIKRTGVQKERPPQLMAVEIDHRGSHKRPHSPIKAQNGAHVFPWRWCFRLQLDHEVEHPGACPLSLLDFSQGWGCCPSLGPSIHHVPTQHPLHPFFAPGSGPAHS